MNNEYGLERRYSVCRTHLSQEDVQSAQNRVKVASAGPIKASEALPLCLQAFVSSGEGDVKYFIRRQNGETTTINSVGGAVVGGAGGAGAGAGGGGVAGTAMEKSDGSHYRYEEANGDDDMAVGSAEVLGMYGAIVTNTMMEFIKANPSILDTLVIDDTFGLTRLRLQVFALVGRHPLTGIPFPVAFGLYTHLPSHDACHAGKAPSEAMAMEAELYKSKFITFLLHYVRKRAVDAKVPGDCYPRVLGSDCDLATIRGFLNGHAELSRIDLGGIREIETVLRNVIDVHTPNQVAKDRVEGYLKDPVSGACIRRSFPPSSLQPQSSSSSLSPSLPSSPSSSSSSTSPSSSMMGAAPITSVTPLEVTDHLKKIVLEELYGTNRMITLWADKIFTRDGIVALALLGETAKESITIIAEAIRLLNLRILHFKRVFATTNLKSTAMCDAMEAGELLNQFSRLIYHVPDHPSSGGGAGGAGASVPPPIFTPLFPPSSPSLALSRIVHRHSARRMLLCRFHFLQAINRHLPASSQGKDLLLDRVKASVTRIMSSPSEEELDRRWLEFKERYGAQFGAFIKYFDGMWMKPYMRRLWCSFGRQYPHLYQDTTNSV